LAFPKLTLASTNLALSFPKLALASTKLTPSSLLFRMCTS
jgi:hypothetical protein